MSRFVEFPNVAKAGKLQHCPGCLLGILLLNVLLYGSGKVLSGGDVVLQLKVVSAEACAVVHKKGIIQVLLGAE